MSHNHFISLFSEAMLDKSVFEKDISISVSGDAELPSYFDVTGLATASIASACLGLADYISTNETIEITIDQRLASLWFGWTLKPKGWKLPPCWDDIAGNYRGNDGWIRLHTNAPHHKMAALKVLGVPADKSKVTEAVSKLSTEELELEISQAGGCAARMRTIEEWHSHPQGIAISSEPLIHWIEGNEADHKRLAHTPDRPLQGVRVLDLTRVLAGPVAGRCLAAFGAEVLRIDPPGWEEPGIAEEVTLGKRCATLDLREHHDRKLFESLLGQADLLIHGYRPGVLDNLGYGIEELRKFNPSLPSTCLNAYGWSGPWSERRGFDSLLQMSSGLSSYASIVSNSDKPVPLPVQALDHATGYLMALAALQCLKILKVRNKVMHARLSLAKVANILTETRKPRITGDFLALNNDDFSHFTEHTSWGDAQRVRPPALVNGITMSWVLGAQSLHSHEPQWVA